MTDPGRVRSYALLSLAGGVLVMAIALLGHDEGATVGRTDRALLASFLVLVGAFGTASAIRPGWGGRAGPSPGVGTGPGEVGVRALAGPPRRGHHPDCGPFAGHTVTIASTVRCAGCTGLAAGSLVMSIMVIGYAASTADARWWEGVAMVIAGLSLVALDLVVALMGRVHPWAGLGLNALMVVGFGLVSVGLLEATGQLAWGLAGTVVSVLWMDTRIQLSRWNHAAVCAVCQEECVAYSL